MVIRGFKVPESSGKVSVMYRWTSTCSSLLLVLLNQDLPFIMFCLCCCSSFNISSSCTSFFYQPSSHQLSSTNELFRPSLPRNVVRGQLKTGGAGSLQWPSAIFWRQIKATVSVKLVIDGFIIGTNINTNKNTEELALRQLCTPYNVTIASKIWLSFSNLSV